MQHLRHTGYACITPGGSLGHHPEAGEQWLQGRNGEQSIRPRRTLENKLWKVAQFGSRPDDGGCDERQRGEEDILRLRCFHLRDLRGKVGIGWCVIGLGYIVHMVGSHGLFVAGQSILAVLIILVNDTGRGALDVLLVYNVVEGIFDLKPIGCSDHNEIFFARQCGRQGRCRY